MIMAWRVYFHICSAKLQGSTLMGYWIRVELVHEPVYMEYNFHTWIYIRAVMNPVRPISHWLIIVFSSIFPPFSHHRQLIFFLPSLHRHLCTHSTKKNKNPNFISTFLFSWVDIMKLNFKEKRVLFFFFLTSRKKGFLYIYRERERGGRGRKRKNWSEK